MLSLLLLIWEHTDHSGVHLSGKPRAVRVKTPLKQNRQRPGKARARVHVPVERCAQVAARLHPVHQLVLWLLRLLGLRDSEVFGLLVGDYRDGWLRVARIGGTTMDVRDVDGCFVRVTARSGTKTSREGSVPAGEVHVDDEAAEGIEERLLRVPRILRRLIEYVIATVHTDLVTGEVDPNARLVPGLQDDDVAGLTAFTSALRRAFDAECGGADGLRFTPHDLRASLNTDLKNAGVKKRVVRYWLGHKTNDGAQLDVNERHYDLGPDAGKLVKVAKVIDRTVRHLGDLRIPTAQRPQWGRATRLAARRTQLEKTWTADGWYRSRGTTLPAADGIDCDSPRLADEVPLRQAAAELNLKDSQVRRMLAAEELGGRKVAWGDREVWVVFRSAIERELARRSQPTLATLSAELGLPYHPLWHLVQALGLATDRSRGEALYLTDEQADAVRAEVRRRAEAADAVMPTTAAAARLQLPHPLVQTLVRRGDLTEAPCGVDTRLMHVTNDSVEAYERTWPTPPGVEPSERVVPISKVGAILDLSRHGVTHLVCTRQLAVTSSNRRQYVGVTSLRRWLDAHPGQGRPGLVAMYSEAQR